MEFTPGAVVGEYTLHSLIGQGASGEVWRAVRIADSQPVAIKFMGEALINSANAAKHRERMEREVSVLKLLHHPCVPTLIGYDLEHFPPYLVMEYIQGESFDKLLSRGDLLRTPVEQRVSMLTQLADALGAAHDLGIVHRDVKPANMIAGEPPHLIDFGLALQMDAAKMTMMIVGTTYYMPPETNVPDALSDIYSFGVVAYEVLFGTHPIFSPEDTFSTNQAFMLMTADRRIRTGQWRIPSRIPYNQLPPDLRYSDYPALDRVFGSVLSPRETRCTSIREFAANLQAAVIPPPAGTPAMSADDLQMLEDQETQLEPDPTQSAVPGSQDERFTILEVKRAEEEEKQTSAKPDESDKKKRWRLFGGKS